MTDLPDYNNFQKWKRWAGKCLKNRKIKIAIIIIPILLGAFYLVWDYRSYKTANTKILETNTQLTQQRNILRDSDDQKSKKITELQFEVQNLRIAFLPFQNLARDLVGSTDTQAMRKLFLILTNLIQENNLLKTNFLTIQRDLLIQKDPATQASNLSSLFYRELISNQDPDRIFYSQGTNIPNDIILILKHVPVTGSVQVWGVTENVTTPLVKPATTNNLAILKFSRETPVISLTNVKFDVSYTIDPSQSNLISRIARVFLGDQGMVTYHWEKDLIQEGIRSNVPVGP